MKPHDVFLATVAAVGVGAAYVLIHERRRKRKKEEKRKAEEPLPKEALVDILREAGEEAAKVAAEVGGWVQKAAQQHNLSEERANHLRQQRFEAVLDEIISGIRKKKGVTEKKMDLAFRQYMEEKEVQTALNNIRRQMCVRTATMQSCLGAAPLTPWAACPCNAAVRWARSSSSPGAGGRAPTRTAQVPASLTRDKLKEVMVFNAVQLERELKPLKQQVVEARKVKPDAQLNPQVLVDMQMRISEAVKTRFGFTDEQVVAAVDKYGAKQDPEFKDILNKISAALESVLSPG